MLKAGALALTMVLAAVLAPCARSQTFAGVPDLDERLGSIRARAEATAANAGIWPRIKNFFSSEAPDVSSYPVRGIDISHYQGEVDWTKVRGQGLAFVYVKASDGKGIQGDHFKKSWEGATAAGLLKGAYHFYDICDGKGAVQAANFIKMVPHEAGMLPPAVDLERHRGCRNLPTKAVFLKQFNAFMQVLERTYGTQPVLYVEDTVYERYLTEVGKEYALWTPDLTHAAPTTPGNRPWTFWQFSFTGRIPGIDYFVDLDVFNGDREALAKLTGDALLAKNRRGGTLR